MKTIDRRTFLRAAGGALVGLPALASLHRLADAAPPARIKRFVTLFFPNGSTMRRDWQRSGSGTDFTMGTAHASLEPHRAKLSMFRGLDGDYGGAPDHSRGTASFLTGSPISDMATPRVAQSIDQAIADALQPPTPIRSLHLGPTPYPAGPPSDTGWPSGYNAYISWSSPTAPNPPLESARVAFDQLFGGGDTVEAERRRRLRQSVLDHTLDQIDAIEPRLGASDRAKLDEYLTAVREVEVTVQEGGVGECGDGVRPGSGLSFPDHTRAMADIVRLALQCDATRIVTWSMDYGFGNQDFTFLGQGRYRHHNLSHSGTDPAIVGAHEAIVRWYMDQLAYVLSLLDGVEVDDHTLLDDTILYMGSDVGDGWSHSHQDLPCILAGGGAGALRPGRLIDAWDTSYDSVLLGLAHAMGAELAGFSGATTPFGDL